MNFCKEYEKDEFYCLRCEWVLSGNTCKLEGKKKVSHKERMKIKSRKYRENHREQSRDADRRHSRKRIILSGKGRPAGYAMIDGSRTLMYEGIKEPRYYCLKDDRCLEFTLVEMLDKWIREVV